MKTRPKFRWFTLTVVASRVDLYIMVMAAPQLGIGVYTPAEAAFYARIRTGMLTRWIHGDGRGDAVVRAQLYRDTEKTITFNDFVQALAIRAIRTQYRDVSLQKIRMAVDSVRTKHNVEYPLAVRHKIYVITEGSNRGEIVIDFNEKMVQVSGKNKDQTLIGPIAELYMDRVTFGADGSPTQYTPMSNEIAGAIILNPHIRFGEPIVEQCGYSAQTLWEASIAEGGLEAAAKAYGVDKSHVALACEYYDYLSTSAA
jgi:uncharacterized protein (DUF433 family)